MKKNNEQAILNDKLDNNKITIILNLIFSILEIIGGILTNSISLISGAIHDITDSISICISNLFNNKSKRKSNNNYSFGYVRYKIIGNFFTSIILLLCSIAIIYFSISRIKHPLDVNYDAMIIFSIFGILINGYAAYKTKEDNKNNMIDVFGWIIVLIGSILIKILNNSIIDPVVSLLVAIFILYQVYKYIYKIFTIIMEKVPNNLNINQIQKDLIEENKLIKELNNTNIWALDDNDIYFTSHILLNESIDENGLIELKNNIKKYLINLNIKHITLEIVYNNETKRKTN